MQPSSTFATALIAAALSLGLPGVSHARYVGPSAMDDIASVKDILDHPMDGQPVRLEGRLLRQVGKHRYVFSDGTAEIEAEIDEDDFPPQPVDEHTRVEITGEVDTGLRRPPEIEVETLRVIQ